MRLVSIINFWYDTVELLWPCIENHLKFADHVIIVGSETSNHGKTSFVKLKYGEGARMSFIQCEPDEKLAPLINETRKRNYGIQKAIEMGFTHYFCSDTDELYNSDEVKEVKELFNSPHLNGVVCKLKVFIGKPTLWVNDHTIVPFIHVLKPQSYVGNFREYPYAYDSEGNAHIDPSRRPNEYRGIILCNAVMRHFSYVRKDIDLKINNSSANLKRSADAIKRDIANAAPGYKVTFNYHQELQECENEFGL